MKKAIFGLLLIAVTSCNTTKSDNFDWGYVVEGNYENKFLGIDWPVPENWVYDDTFAQQWAKANKPDLESFAESVYYIKQRIKMEPKEVKESMLFQLTKYKPDNEKQNKLLILLYGENLDYIEGANIQDLDDYITQTIKEVSGNPQVILDSEEPESKRIGGTNF